MEVVEKIVYLTDEQFEELLTNGQIEVNGELKVYDENTLYVTPNNNYKWLYDKFYEAVIRPYKIVHTPVVMKSLEQEYEELTDEANGKAPKYVSAVGFSAILKKGDSVVVSTPNFGDFYINGELVTNDYTYNGDNVEIVNVWCFEKKSGDLQMAPKLKDIPNYDIVEVDIKNIGSETPEVNDSYYNYATTIKTYNFNLTNLKGGKTIITDGFSSITSANNLVSSITKKVICYAQTVDCTYGSPFVMKSNLVEVVFPELLDVIPSTDAKSGFLTGCSNPELKLSFPKLKSVAGYNAYYAAFDNVYKVELPPSVKNVGNHCFNNNSIITLNCNKAISINNNWCDLTPSINFTMAKDWQASINIAIAAKNHTKDWFIDLFTNYLHKFEPEEVDGGTLLEFRDITIPLAIFNELTDDEIAIAENKGWTVGGA